MASVSRLGLDVGRFGSVGLGGAEAFATVALALDAGVRLIDCPPDPLAEGVLGEVLPREPASAVAVHTAHVAGGADAVVRRLDTSLRRLRQSRVAAVLAQPKALQAGDGPRLWDALLRLKDEGVVGAVGIAACVCDDPVALARRFRPDLVQLPLSLLDQRLLASGALDQIAEAGVEVRLRSTFLDDAVTATPAPVSLRLSRLRQLLAEAGVDPMQAALGFALTRPQASKVVVGVGSPTALRAVLKAAAAPCPALDWNAIAREAARVAEVARCRAA